MGILNAALRGVSCKTQDVPTFKQIILFLIFSLFKTGTKKEFGQEQIFAPQAYRLWNVFHVISACENMSKKK